MFNILGSGDFELRSVSDRVTTSSSTVSSVIIIGSSNNILRAAKIISLITFYY